MRQTFGVVFLCITSASLTTAQTNVTTTTKKPQTNQPNDTVTELDPKHSYCFRFTWLGPGYDNTTDYNTTCEKILDNREFGVPCRQPLVVTYDGSYPNIDYMWEHHQTQVICRRAKGHVCAKVSYIYDNSIQNATYMCTKVYGVNEGPVTSGCYTQTIDGYDVELCVCESPTGVYKPCNSAFPSGTSPWLFLLVYFVNHFIT